MQTERKRNRGGSRDCASRMVVWVLLRSPTAFLNLDHPSATDSAHSCRASSINHTQAVHLSCQITIILAFFSRFLPAICVRPNSCNPKPPRRHSCANASILLSGHAWTLIYTSPRSFTQKDILLWNQRVMTHAIYMQPRCFEQGKPIRLCISSTFRLKLSVVDA